MKLAAVQLHLYLRDILVLDEPYRGTIKIVFSLCATEPAPAIVRDRLRSGKADNKFDCFNITRCRVTRNVSLIVTRDCYADKSNRSAFAFHVLSALLVIVSRSIIYGA